MTGNWPLQPVGPVEISVVVAGVALVDVGHVVGSLGDEALRRAEEHP